MRSQKNKVSKFEMAFECNHCEKLFDSSKLDIDL